MIDTSSWIDAMRRDGDPEIKARVVALVREGTAAWCDIVRLELWNGLRGTAERKQMEELEVDVINLPTSDAVWETGCAGQPTVETASETTPEVPARCAHTAAMATMWRNAPYSP